jgi:hypothetical protein
MAVAVVYRMDFIWRKVAPQTNGAAIPDRDDGLVGDRSWSSSP